MVDLFGTVASTFFQDHGDAPSAKFDIAGHETSVIIVDDREIYDSPFLNIILEIVFDFLIKLVNLRQCHLLYLVYSTMLSIY